MALMIIRHRVKDFADWKKVFDGHAGAQKGTGLTNPKVFRSVGDTNETVILFDVADVASAKTFGTSPELKAAMRSAGVLDEPTLYLVEEAR